jgi:hypothetical protein
MKLPDILIGKLIEHLAFSIVASDKKISDHTDIIAGIGLWYNNVTNKSSEDFYEKLIKFVDVIKGQRSRIDGNTD